MCQKYMKAKFLTVEKRKTGKRISLSDGFCFSCHSERRSEGVAMSFRAKVRGTGVEESASVNRPLDCRSR